jgi:hypothetical protein
MMNLEETIRSCLGLYTVDWFNSTFAEFSSHKDYDPENQIIPFEVERVESVPIVINDKGEIIESIDQITYDTVELNFNSYCWNRATVNGYSTNHDLKGSLEQIIQSLEDAISHVNSDAALKHKIILMARDEIIENINALVNEGPEGYKNLMWKFAYKFRKHLNDNYKNVKWIVDKVMKKYSPNRSKQKDKIIDALPPKRLLRKSFFLEMFSLQDDYNQTIIDREDLNKIEKFASIFYNIYTGKRNPSETVINFVWSKESVYYLLNRINATNPKISMKVIAGNECLKIKGKNISFQALRKGASDFKKANSKFKDFIDVLIDKEINR